jgi:hypothetical protein
MEQIQWDEVVEKYFIPKHSVIDLGYIKEFLLFLRRYPILKYMKENPSFMLYFAITKIATGNLLKYGRLF